MKTSQMKCTQRLLAAVAASTTLVLVGAVGAMAAPLPNRFLLSSHVGDEVNKITHANTCTTKEECQPAPAGGSIGPGGFTGPFGVAVDNDPASLSYEHVYVADTENHRVQELTATGQFVSMFGWDVNRTKVEASAPQAERDICTAASGNVCQAGTEGSAPGQFGFPQSIAVDAASGDVYVAEFAFGESGGEFAVSQRVQKFTAAGQFVLEIGKAVNETTDANLCTAAETCRGAKLLTLAEAESESETGAFDFEFFVGSIVTVGGPEDLLYVGDHGRIQKFKASGEPAGQVSLAAISPSGKAITVAVDSTGTVFVSDNEVPGVHEYDAGGVLQSEEIDAASFGIQAVALDPYGHLAIIDSEGGVRGLLYSATDVKISEFAPSSGVMPGYPKEIAFSSSGRLYVGEPEHQEIEAYVPVVFPETHTCAADEVTGTSAKPCGEINPDGIPAKGFFEYGTSPSLGSLTPIVFEGASEAFTPFFSQLTGLVPNQSYRYRVAVEAEANGERPTAHGEEMEFKTGVLEPQISAPPTSSFVQAQSAILNATVNPEHATTTYHFEYGACPTLAGCPTIHNTSEEASSVYGTIGTTQEIVGLAPQTTYSFRFVADNEFEESGRSVGGKVASAEGSFTTPPGASPTAQTAGYSALTPTSATISGLVDPDGLPATYALELGVYDGAETQYGIVFSGPAGSSAVPLEETLPLTGLQPGTTYAYRIEISSGYIANATHTLQGAPVTFTTPGLPAALTPPPPLAQLPIPQIPFPKAAKPPKKTKKKVKAAKKHKKAKPKKRKKTHH
jgi:DNA-binding beta-propeller fold protein YncE